MFCIQKFFLAIFLYRIVGIIWIPSIKLYLICRILRFWYCSETSTPCNENQLKLLFSGNDFKKSQPYWIRYIKFCIFNLLILIQKIQKVLQFLSQNIFINSLPYWVSHLKFEVFNVKIFSSNPKNPYDLSYMIVKMFFFFIWIIDIQSAILIS